MAAVRTLRHDPNFAASGAKGENVAWRSGAGADVGLQLHNQFMNSPGHRANLLNPRWTRLGIGYCGANGHWVTERFSDGRVSAPVAAPPTTRPPAPAPAPPPPPAPAAAPAQPSPVPAEATDGDAAAADGDSEAAADATQDDAEVEDAQVAVPESVGAEADQLPFTGSGSGQLALYAAVLLLAGGWLLRRTTLGGRHARSRRGR
jgi:hypothetical protein